MDTKSQEQRNYMRTLPQLQKLLQRLLLFLISYLKYFCNLFIF